LADNVVIPLSEAQRVIAAAEAKAREIGQPLDIAGVDAGIPLLRDGSVIGAIGVSGGSGNQDQT
jgi:uncharacterized protein GlcG (DUF336 family)